MSYVATTDWNEVTAIATAALAGLTFVLAIAAIIAARYAKRDIDTQLQTSAEDLQVTREATEAAQAAAQRQIEASHRPLLIDVAPHGPISINDEVLETRSSPTIRMEFPGGHIAESDPRQGYIHLDGPWASIAVPLRNVGRGLAVIDPRGVRVVGGGLGEMAGCTVRRERVPPGETTRVLCTPRLIQGFVPPYPWAWEVLVPYRDFEGGQAAVAVVRLERMAEEAGWHLVDIKQVAPQDIALPPV